MLTKLGCELRSSVKEDIGGETIIQPLKMASATSLALSLARGNDSGQRVTLYTTVSWYVKHLKGWSGHMRPTFTWLKQNMGSLYSDSRARWWTVTLTCWKVIHDLAYPSIS